MADVLALHISELLSMDTSSQQAALRGLGAPGAAPGAPGLTAAADFASLGINPAYVRVAPRVAYLAPPPGLCGPPGPGLPKDFSSLASTADSASTCSGEAEKATSPVSPRKTFERHDTDSTMSPNDGASDCSDPTSEDKDPKPRAVSTLKIKNLPRRCTQEEILAAVAEVGFDGCYDFFFLPLGGQQSRQNRGYAFVNFTDAVTASRFRSAFHRYRLREKAVEVVAAPIQGKQQNVEQYGRLSTETEGGTAKAIMLVL